MPFKLTELRTPEVFTASTDTQPQATIVVLHPWWGVTETIVGCCRDLAKAGYLAVAPDLYRGEIATTPEQAEKLRKKKRGTSDWRQIVGVLQQAREEQAPDSRIGLLGYSMGGHWAYWLSSQARPEIPRINATVVYYATRACDFSRSTAAFQVHLAETDPFVSDSGLTRMERALRKAGRPLELHHYPGTGHWFAEPDQESAYVGEAASLAWERTIRFFGKHLLGTAEVNDN